MGSQFYPILPSSLPENQASDQENDRDCSEFAAVQYTFRSQTRIYP